MLRAPDLFLVTLLLCLVFSPLLAKTKHAPLPESNSPGRTTYLVTQRDNAGADELPEHRAKAQATESVRALAQTIKQCPQEVLSNERFGKGPTEFYQLIAGPPQNLVWDVSESDSVRSPFGGYIQFVVPLSLSVPPGSFKKFIEKHSRLWELYLKQPPSEYRYEFDIGPDGLALTKALHRDEGQTDWKSAAPAYCWGKAAQGAQTAPGPAKREQ